MNSSLASLPTDSALMTADSSSGVAGLPDTMQYSFSSPPILKEWKKRSNASRTLAVYFSLRLVIDGRTSRCVLPLPS